MLERSGGAQVPEEMRMSPLPPRSQQQQQHQLASLLASSAAQSAAKSYRPLVECAAKQELESVALFTSPSSTQYTVLSDADLLPEERSSLLAAVVSALREINIAGVCHLDIKPAHIFVARTAPAQFKVTIIDFGLSAFTGRDEEDFVRPAFGSCPYPFSGNLAYASVFHHLAHPLDPASDLQSLLFVFHELEYGPLRWRRTIAAAGTQGERLSAACLAKLRTLGGSTTFGWLAVARRLMEHRCAGGDAASCYDLVLTDRMVSAKEPLPSEIGDCPGSPASSDALSPPRRLSGEQLACVGEDDAMHSHPKTSTSKKSGNASKEVSNKLEEAFAFMLCRKLGESLRLEKNGKYGPYSKYEYDASALADSGEFGVLRSAFGQAPGVKDWASLPAVPFSEPEFRIFAEISALYNVHASGHENWDPSGISLLRHKLRQMDRELFYMGAHNCITTESTKSETTDGFMLAPTVRQAHSLFADPNKEVDIEWLLAVAKKVHLPRLLCQYIN
eukprot:m51a1_g9582 putative serine threonine protein kinase (503) ;mRNA; r:987541-990045